MISILGDSISTFAGWVPTADGFNREPLSRYPQDDLLTDVNETWWLQLIHDLDAKLGINDSWRGAMITGAKPVTTGDSGENAAFGNRTRVQNLGSNGTPDLILVYGGTNDYAHLDSLGAFDPALLPETVDLATRSWTNLAEAYAQTLLRLRYYDPDAQLLAILPGPTATYYSTARLNEGNAILSAVCEHYGVPFVDLRDSGLTAGDLPDGIHPGEAGMDKITDAVLTKLLADCPMAPGENEVHSVTHVLENAESSRAYIKGVSDGRPFETVLTGRDLSVSVTMGGEDVTASAWVDGTISIPAVTGDLVITATGAAVPAWDCHLQALPDPVCAGVNLWSELEHDPEYYGADGWTVHPSGTVYSVTFPVTPEERVYAASFAAAGENGSGSVNGIRVTWFTETEVLQSCSAEDVYKEFAANGYLTVPEDAAYVCVPMWTNTDGWELYLLDRAHAWDEGFITLTPTGTTGGELTYTCTRCGETEIETLPATGESAWYVLEENDSGYTLRFVGSGAVTTSLWLREKHAGEITEIYVPASVTSLPADSLDGLPTAETVVAPYNSDIYRAAAATGLRGKLSALRILVLGNSHSSCFMQNFNTIASDLKNAGLRTVLSYNRISHGNRSIGTTDNQHLAHLEDAAYDKLRTKTYDLVVIQDFRESTSGLENYPELVQSAVTALKGYQPGAQVAVFADWNSSYATAQGGFATLEESYAASLRSIAAAEGIADFIIDAATPFMNARTALAERTIFNDSNHVFTTPGYALSGNIFVSAVFHHFRDALDSMSELDYFSAVTTYQGASCDFEAILNSVENAAEHPGTVTPSPASCHVMSTCEGYAASCEAEGLNTYYVCSVCGRAFQNENGTMETTAEAEVIPALGHSPGEAVRENEAAATCIVDGSYDEAVYCTICGKELSREMRSVAALGHDWGDWTVTTSPTCTDPGEESRACRRCGETETRTLNALGHDCAAVVTAPTCTEQGYTTHTCTRCGNSFIDSYVNQLVTVALTAEGLSLAGLPEGVTAYVSGCTAAGRQLFVVPLRGNAASLLWEEGGAPEQLHIFFLNGGFRPMSKPWDPTGP